MRQRKEAAARKIRDSIIERDQATKRKVDDLVTMQANSNNGSDQGADSRGSHVAATNKDPLKVEFNKVGMQPSINRGVDVVAEVVYALGSCTNNREAQSIGNLIKAGKAKMNSTKS